MAVGLAEMLVNFSESYEPIVRVITGGAYVMGMAFALMGIYQLKVYGESRTMMSNNVSLKGPVGYLLIAAVLLYLPTGIDTMVMTFYGSTTTPLSYANPEDSVLPDEAVLAVLRLVQILGLLAFIRGWLLLAQSSKQGAQPALGKALTHIIAGMLAINIVGTKNVISATFGV